MTSYSSSTSPRTVPWRQRLETRVLLGILLVAGLALGAMLFSATRVITGHSLTRSREDLRAARQTFYRLAMSRAEFASSQCRLIAELPILRSMMTDARLLAEQDLATIGVMAAEYRSKLHADFCLVTDSGGRTLGLASSLKHGELVHTLQPATLQAASGHPSCRVEAIHGGLFLVVSEPARFQDEILGTLTAGYRLDDRLARDLAMATHSEVTFLCNGNLCGSSLSPERKLLLQRFLATQRSASLGLRETPSLWRMEGEAYVGGSFPVFPGERISSAGRLVLLKSWEPTQAFLDEVQRTLLLIGVVVFLLALECGLILSRRMTRPLQELTATAEAVAGGDWTQRASLHGGAEAALMAAAFNEMTGNLQRYYQESQTHSARLEEALHELQSSYTATLDALSRALDARDNETDGHSRRVTHYALRIAGQMELDPEQTRILEIGAMLHDIGKIGIPDAILRKPGRLTDEEMAQMRRHCEYGLRIVEGVPHLEQAADVVQFHHERFDGAGYPHGLSATQIPLVARIFSAADTLDAMTSDRPYRRAGSFADAMREIQRCSGAQFDPAVVMALEQIIGELQEWRLARGMMHASSEYSLADAAIQNSASTLSEGTGEPRRNHPSSGVPAPAPR